MAKPKYERWRTPDGLLLLAAWARDGLTDEQIAHNCGVSRKTLAQWKITYGDIGDALARAREVADIEVENALYKKCLGYNVPITKHYKLKHTEYDPKTGRKTKEEEKLVEVEEQIHVPADTMAQKFWLSNRLPDKWREKQLTEIESDKPIEIQFPDALKDFVK